MKISVVDNLIVVKVLEHDEEVFWGEAIGIAFKLPSVFVGDLVTGVFGKFVNVVVVIVKGCAVDFGELAEF